MKEELIRIYKTILELNFQINSALNAFPKKDFDDFNKKLEKLLDEKNIFIKKLRVLKENSVEELEKLLKEADLDELSEHVNKIEEENLKLAEEKKNHLASEINRLNKSTKVLAAYKYNQQIKPRLVDEKIRFI